MQYSTRDQYCRLYRSDGYQRWSIPFSAHSVGHTDRTRAWLAVSMVQALAVRLA